MRGLKFLILGVAVAAGVGAIALVKGELDRARRSAESTTMAAPPPPPPSAMNQGDVLVVTRALRLGETLRDSDLRWQPWPREAITESYITRDEAPKAASEFVGAVVRAAFADGEPMLDAKVLRVNHPGVMSAMIRDGLRAFAISIAPETGAGGFVLPGDFVDVILTRGEEIEEYRRDGSTRTVTLMITQTLVGTVRVMAVDTALDANGEAALDMKRTVTLEVTPEQAELLSLAEQKGRITLALRGVAELVTEEGEIAKNVMPKLLVDPRMFHPRYIESQYAGGHDLQQPVEETADARTEAVARKSLTNEILFVRGVARQRALLE